METNGNRFILSITGKAPPYLLLLPRCPYMIDLRLWNIKDGISQEAMEGAPRTLPRARQLTPHLEITSIKKERRVIVDILLRGMEDPIC